jgi:hypothetical protein
MLPLIILAAIMAVVFYVYQLSRHVLLGFFSLLAVELLSFTFGTSQGLLAGFHLDPMDFIGICLLLAGCIRTARNMNRLHVSRLLALVYIALLTVSIVHGLVTYDLKSVANESRSLVPSVTGMLYFLTAPTDAKSMRRYTWLYLSFGIALCIVAILATVGLNVGSSAWAGGDLQTEQAAEGRALPSGAAAGIATCVFLSLGLGRSPKQQWLSKLMPTIFLVFAIYLRHRTIWIMLAVAIAVLPFVDGKLFRRLLPTIAIGFVLLAGFVVYGQALQGGVDVNQFSDSAQNEGTILWRIDSWKDLVLGEEQTLQSVLIGKSAGSGFHRLDLATGRSIDVAPHNEYITRYLRTGVIGAVCVMFFLIRPIKRLRALGRSDKMAVYPSVASWTISVFMIAVYGVTYGIDAHSFALVGICNALISSREPTLTGADRATSVWSLSMNSGSTIG